MTRRWLAAMALLVLATLAAAGVSGSDDRFVFEGACYCRIAGALQCFGMMTEAACTRRCADELCDDSFWLERRPCWNWGYGG